MKKLQHSAINLGIEELNLGVSNAEVKDKNLDDMKDHRDKDHSDINHCDKDYSDIDYSDIDHTDINHSDIDYSDVNRDIDHSDKNHNDNDHILYLTERGIIKRVKDGWFHPEDKVTTEQFVAMIIRSSKGDIEPTRDDWSSGYIDYAMNKRIIEDYDITNRSNLIERRSVARIVHEALLTEFSERDENEWSAAKNLLDLYSCHTCVMHIAQVYVKGIMFEREHKVFDLKGNLTLSEAIDIVVRMLVREKRIPRTKVREVKSIMIQPNEAWEMMLSDRKAIMIDVRTSEDYKQGHIDGSICIPLHDLTNNPYSVSMRKDTAIILYCQMGYKSSLAAQVLIDAGYSNIYTIPGIAQFGYNLTS